MLNIRTDVHMRRILSDRPIGKPAQCLARFLFKTWAAERLSGQLSKLQPNQALCHFMQIQPQAVKLKNALAHLRAAGTAAPLASKRNLGGFRWSDVGEQLYTCGTASLRVASYHNETGIQDTYLNSYMAAACRHH